MQKILIIEDDEKLREELETFLNRNGFIATSLKKFDNAVADILEIKADLLLIDIKLPQSILSGLFPAFWFLFNSPTIFASNIWILYGFVTYWSAP